MNINYGILIKQLTLIAASFGLDFEFYYYCSYGVSLLSLFLLLRLKIFRISAEF